MRKTKYIAHVNNEMNRWQNVNDRIGKLDILSVMFENGEDMKLIQ